MFACPDNYISIALLNVRSIVAKLPESAIERDHSYTSASILCFTETWLTPELSSTIILGHHQVIRSDRMSGDNKGGVLISIPANIQASNQTEFSHSGVIISPFNHPFIAQRIFIHFLRFFIMAHKQTIKEADNITDLEKPTLNTSLHGAITSLSPIKKGSKSLFFDRMLVDNTSKV